MLLHVINPRIRGVSTTGCYGCWWGSGDRHEGPLVFYRIITLSDLSVSTEDRFPRIECLSGLRKVQKLESNNLVLMVKKRLIWVIPRAKR